MEARELNIRCISEEQLSFELFEDEMIDKGLDIGSGKDLDEYILDKGKSTERKIPYHLIVLQLVERLLQLSFHQSF